MAVPLGIGLLGFDAVLLGEQYPTFRKIVVPSKRREILVERGGVTSLTILIFSA
jgi:hypothetical protein